MNSIKSNFVWFFTRGPINLIIQTTYGQIVEFEIGLGTIHWELELLKTILLIYCFVFKLYYPHKLIDTIVNNNRGSIQIASTRL